MTYKDLIRTSLEEIGVVADGQTMRDSQADRAFETLLTLIDAFNAEAPCIFTQGESTFPLSNGVQSYTLGTGGVFNILRPEWVDEGAFIRSTDVLPVEYHRQRPATDAEWNAIRIKTLTDSLVQIFRVVPSFPLATVQVWPVPNVGTLSIILRYPTPLITPAALATTLSLPPGARRMVRTNLSVELAAGPFARKITPELAKMAIDSKATFERRNIAARPIVLRPDPLMNPSSSIGGGYDIRSNGYR